jgi:predicted Zn-dependent protease
MKKFIPIFAILCLIFTACASNPLTGKSTMAFVSNDELFPSSFEQYSEFLSQSTIVKGTPEAAMVDRVGNRIKQAAEKWLASEGQAHYLDGYEWEYHLIQSDEINAWCMPGGKIAFYTGILPVLENEDAMAVVMGHEVAHALLNHGQQRVSASYGQEVVGAGLSIGLGVLGASEMTQAIASTVYGLGSQVGVMLPFSRSHESEADRYGLILMAIAGYNPDESVPFWQRMGAMGGGTPEWLSTHPSDETRANNLRGWIPEAKAKAAELK